jgi:hypothetical protein
MNTTMTPFLGMLLGAAPLLVVYLVGILLAIVWWGRWPQACGLVLAGCSILFIAGIVQPLIQSQIMLNRSGNLQSVGQTLAMLGMIFTIVRAAGFGLLIWAAFTGRPDPFAPVSAFEPLPPRNQ